MKTGPTVDHPAVAAASCPCPATLLAIQPPSGDDPLPTTLTQMKAWLAGGVKKPLAVDSALLTAGSAEALNDRLTELSVRYHTAHLCLLTAITPRLLKALILALVNRQPALRTDLACNWNPSAADTFGDIGSTLGDQCPAIVQIQWHLAGPLTDLTPFRSLSRAGVWNHLILDAGAATPANRRTVALQPNILHSWQSDRADRRQVEPPDGYGRVRPLPGRPLWQALSDPVDRFLLIDRLTKDRLVRLRVDEDGERFYALGDALTYRFVPPDRLPPGRLDEICDMVAAGGSVAATHVRQNLQRAFLVGYAEERGCIVGNSSLKHPRDAYIATVRQKSGLDLTGYVERGYTSVRPEYRGLGIGTRLLEGLTARAGERKIFSVIGEDNLATQIIARRNRSKKVATYFSDKAGKPVGIWMPEWMIDRHGA